MRNKKKKFLLIMIFVLIIVFLTTGYALLSSKLSLQGNASIKNNPNILKNVELICRQDSWSSATTVTYSYNCQIENKSDKDIDGWQIEIKVPEDANLTNGSEGIYTINSGLLSIKNKSYNNKIPSGGQTGINFAITTTNFNYQMTDYVIKKPTGSIGGDEDSEVNEDTMITLYNYSANAELIDNSNGLLKYKISIKSYEYSKSINGWILFFNGNTADVHSISEGFYVDYGQQVKITSSKNIMLIGPNSSISFDITFKTTNSSYKPSNFTLKGNYK